MADGIWHTAGPRVQVGYHDRALRRPLLTSVLSGGYVLAGALVGLAASLPFVRGLASGETFYFRDLSRQFFPVRRFVLEGLQRGELRFWNPLVHEGEPLYTSPISYPGDLLQLLSPDVGGLSVLLALHVPFAALAFLLLARGLGLAPSAAAAGSLVYALGGFSLSTLNLYLHLQAVAWAPLVVLSLLRASRGGPRAWVVGGLVTATAFATTGAVLVGQAILLGLLLAASWDPARWARVAVPLILGLGLCAPVLLVMTGQVEGSAREMGFSMKQALGFSVHPVTLGQVVVAGLLGDPSNLADRFWAVQYFEAFPYYLSFYLGALALSVAVVGLRYGRGVGGRLLLVVGVGLCVSLGKYVHLDLVLEALPFLKAFRYPCKAFFSVHLGVALLVSLGAHALGRDETRRAWRWLTGAVAVGGGLLALSPLLPRVLPSLSGMLLSGFLPGVTSSRRYEVAEFVLHDAFTGGMLALAAGLAGCLVLARRLRPGVALVAVVTLLVVDLLRAGAGLNPTAKPSFFELSPEMRDVAEELREDGGRVFTFDPELGDAYWQARRVLKGSAEVWTTAVLMETLTPHYNMPSGVATAYGRDLKMLIPEYRIFPPKLAGCRGLPAIAEHLRGAGVSHVLSLGPLSHPLLRLEGVHEPKRIAPTAVYVYAMRQPLPLRHVASEVLVAPGREAAEALASQPGFREAGGVVVEAPFDAEAGATGRVLAEAGMPGRIELQVEADRPTAVVVRDAWAPGWTARVNGRDAVVLRADGRHCAVPIPAGKSQVRLRYRPPGLGLGLLVAGLTVGVLVVLLLLGRSAEDRSGARSSDGPGGP